MNKKNTGRVKDLDKFGRQFGYQGYAIRLMDRGISVRAYVNEKPVDGFYANPTDAYLAAREHIHSLIMGDKD